VINTLSKDHGSWVPSEKVEYIMNKALDIITYSRGQDREECKLGNYNNRTKCLDFERSLLILQIMKNLFKNPNITFSFKAKFFQYACKILSELYNGKLVRVKQNLI